MAKYSNPERIREIVRRRLRGEPISLISADMGLSRTYIYSLLARLPKEKGAGQEKNKTSSPVPTTEEFQVVMDYLERYPSRKQVKENGKKRTDEIVIHDVAEKHELSEDQVRAILCRVTTLHPMVSRFPLYSGVEKWKRDNLVTMQDLSSAAGVTVQGLSRILNGLDHLPLETARRIQTRSGLSLYEIYMDLLELEKELHNFDKQKK